MLARRWAPSLREEARGEKRGERERIPPGSVRGPAGVREGEQATRLSRTPDLISPHLHPRLLPDREYYMYIRVVPRTHHERISPRRHRVSSFRRPRSPLSCFLQDPASRNFLHGKRMKQIVALVNEISRSNSVRTKKKQVKVEDINNISDTYI